MKVLAIIPTYNECRNIPVLIGRINAAVRGHALDILVVDDNSPDGTAECVRGLQQAHPNVMLRVRPGIRIPAFVLSRAIAHAASAIVRPRCTRMQAAWYHEVTHGQAG